MTKVLESISLFYVVTYYFRSINRFYWTYGRLLTNLTRHDMIYCYKNSFIFRTDSLAPSWSGLNWTLETTLWSCYIRSKSTCFFIKYINRKNYRENMTSVSSDSAIDDCVFEKSGPAERIRIDGQDMDAPLTISSPRG